MAKKIAILDLDLRKLQNCFGIECCSRDMVRRALLLLSKFESFENLAKDGSSGLRTKMYSKLLL
jgi:hypothetical protein